LFGTPQSPASSKRRVNRKSRQKDEATTGLRTKIIKVRKIIDYNGAGRLTRRTAGLRKWSDE